jgi:hypothetical protein
MNVRLNGIDTAGFLQSGTSSILRLGNVSSNTGQLEFANAGSGSILTLQAGVTSTPYTMVLPTGLGTAGQCLAVSSVVGSTQNLGYTSCSGGMSSLTLAGTAGSNQAITDGDTITIAAGTNITTTGGTVDKVTVATVNNPSFSGVITSTVATGTAPLTVASTTKVANLNADLLDGLDSTAFQAAGSYLTAEADTLATVTGRGSTTSTATTFTGGATIRGLTVNTATGTQDQIILQAAALGANRFNGTITNADLTAAQTWTLPNASGTLITTGNLTSITSVGTLTAGVWQGTAIGAQYGGTGQISYAVGDLLYASGATTLSRLADVGTGSCLVSGGVGAAPTWGACGGGGGSGVSSLNTLTGGLTIQGTANRITVNAVGTTITLNTPQDINTTSNVTFGTLTVGDATNYVKLNSNFSTTGRIYGGSGRPTKQIKLVPEFAGAVFSADGGGDNVGYMTSDHVTGHNYYAWATDQGTAQDYDIIIMYQLPSDFDDSSSGANGFVSNSFKLWAQADSTTSTSVAYEIKDVDGTSCSSGTISFANTSWNQATLTTPSTSGGCTYAANDLITIIFKPSAIQPQTNFVRIGEFQFDYKAKF